MARHSLLSFLLGICASIAAGNCLEAADAPKGARPAAFEVMGVFREIRGDGAAALISHDAIPGFMEAMTMEFAIKGGADLKTLRAGDRVKFRLRVERERSWIEELRKTDAPAAPAPSSEPEPIARPLQPGDRVPDAALVDQIGRTFHLSDLKGRVVALTFIFTRCPLPDYCPLLSRNFAAAQQELAKRGAGGAPWSFLSVTIDPAYDTPARLADYAQAYGADSARWTFATGGAAEINSLGSAFGLTVATDSGRLNHNLRTAVIGADGRVERIFAGNDWQPSDLADEVQHALSVSSNVGGAPVK